MRGAIQGVFRPCRIGQKHGSLLHGAKAGNGESRMPGPARRTDVSNDEGRYAGCVSADVDENYISYGFCKSDNIIRLEEIESEILLALWMIRSDCAGTNLAWFGIDELTFTSEEAGQGSRPVCEIHGRTDYAGIRIWTPNGQDWVYRRFIHRRSGGMNA